MKAIAMLLLLACPLVAQTKPDIRQTKAPSSPPVVVVVFQAGKPVLAALGPGLVLDATASPPVLRASAGQPTELRLQKQGSGWPLSQACGKLFVFRNGVRQLAGEDFTVVSGAVVFRSGASDNTDPSEAGDVVVAECWQ